MVIEGKVENLQPDGTNFAISHQKTLTLPRNLQLCSVCFLTQDCSIITGFQGLVNLVSVKTSAFLECSYDDTACNAADSRATGLWGKKKRSGGFLLNQRTPTLPKKALKISSPAAAEKCHHLSEDFQTFGKCSRYLPLAKYLSSCVLPSYFNMLFLTCGPISRLKTASVTKYPVRGATDKILDNESGVQLAFSHHVTYISRCASHIQPLCYFPCRMCKTENFL